MTVRFTESYDVVVVGAGHAGCEAAMAAARMGLKTALYTINLDLVAQMSCNPAVGGIAKGHLVREIDALGGVMGEVIDAVGIQFRLLNTSRGPAVWSRARRADKKLYRVKMRQVLESEPNLRIKQAEVIDLVWKTSWLVAIGEPKLSRHVRQRVSASAMCAAFGSRRPHGRSRRRHRDHRHISQRTDSLRRKSVSRRTVRRASVGAAGRSLRRLGLSGPAQDGHAAAARCAHHRFHEFQEQPGDPVPTPFSFRTKAHHAAADGLLDHLHHADTHRIIRENVHRAPLYSGQIKGIGPRYCPSIEDKIVKFPDKAQHQIFLEPEGLDTNEIYVNGMSTSHAHRRADGDGASRFRASKTRT